MDSFAREARMNTAAYTMGAAIATWAGTGKQLTWLALDEDQAARSRRVEQLTALRGL